jgi:hypothetical protein
VSVLGGVQPDLLHRLRDRHGGQDGFIDRILWTYPEVEPSFWNTASIGEQTADNVFEAFAALRQTPDHGVVLPTADALSLWAEWYDRNAVTISGLAGLAAGVANKLPIQTARLALILHAMGDLRGERPTLQAQTMQSAIDLAEYFREQFWTILPLIAGNPRGEAHALADSIRQHLRSGQSMTRTDLYDAHGRRVNRRDLNQALDELLEAGEVIRVLGASTGGRPPEIWHLNPALGVPA